MGLVLGEREGAWFSPRHLEILGGGGVGGESSKRDGTPDADGRGERIVSLSQQRSFADEVICRIIRHL